MDEFDRIYAEVKAEKRNRQKEFKKVKKVSDRLDIICKVLSAVSSAKDETIEKIAEFVIKE